MVASFEAGFCCKATGAARAELAALHQSEEAWPLDRFRKLWRSDRPHFSAIIEDHVHICVIGRTPCYALAPALQFGVTANLFAIARMSLLAVQHWLSFLVMLFVWSDFTRNHLIGDVCADAHFCVERGIVTKKLLVSQNARNVEGKYFLHVTLY